MLRVFHKSKIGTKHRKTLENSRFFCTKTPKDFHDRSIFCVFLLQAGKLSTFSAKKDCFLDFSDQEPARA
jgi:hypothetical protein